jgi:hypoxanthine phosphoribosyltransferase
MTDADDAEREILTWELFGEATRDLARSVADADFRADLVLSVARGGLTVGGALAYALSVKNCATINVEFYTGVDERLPVPVVLPPVLNPVDVTGLKVLVADDVADSGRTLELVRKVVDEHVAEVRTVVLYQKPQSVIDADFVWRRTDRWINFPWSSQAPIVGPRGVDA